MTTQTKEFGRPPTFTVKLSLWLSEDQQQFVADEVSRRRRAGITSDIPAAHGGNPNVNRGMIIREALELMRQQQATKG